MKKFIESLVGNKYLNEGQIIEEMDDRGFKFDEDESIYCDEDVWAFSKTISDIKRIIYLRIEYKNSYPVITYGEWI